MVPTLEPIERLVLDANQMMTEHPPVWRDRNKQLVYDIACPPGTVHRGHLVYTRWQPMALPERVSPEEAIRCAEAREDLYDYTRVLPGDGVEWHVNFADPHLFVAYGSSLFAQDEMQVAEHPVLGSLKEALTARGASTRTEQGGRPTPVLVMGAERRCRVATDRDPSQGRPYGLYGNAFAAAPTESIRRATTPIAPPTVTNLIAMAAPSGGVGRYTAAQVEHVLTTAFTAFRAGVAEAGTAPVAVHTGFWGCGAFGGNRILMTMLQVIAAGMAGVDRLVFHTVDQVGRQTFESAVSRMARDVAGTSIEPRDLVERLVQLGLEWGVSDGN